MFVAACEVSTSVEIEDSSNPPTFKLSGNGYLYHFIVLGPYSSEEELRTPSASPGVIWQLSPDEHANTKVDHLPQIKYGGVPQGFKQDQPGEGAPRALEPGKFYAISSPSINANFNVFCFRVEANAVFEVSCD